MPTCLPPPTPELLRALASTLLEETLPAPFAFAIVRAAPGAIDVAVKPLPATDPIGSLYGFVAPACWQSFGVVATGTARHLDDPQRPMEVRVVHLVDRTGLEINLTRGEIDIDSADVVGRVPDVCKRVLGIPTPPPTHAESLLWALDWLDRIVACAIGRDLGAAPPTWGQLQRLDRARPADRFPWPILRRLSAEGQLEVGSIPPHLAAWMDDGLFSREAIASYPEAGDLLGDLAELLPAATLRKVIRRLGGCTP